jgi:hypothetical protein
MRPAIVSLIIAAFVGVNALVAQGAAVDIYAFESGGDVVFSYSGSIDTSGLGAPFTTSVSGGTNWVPASGRVVNVSSYQAYNGVAGVVGPSGPDSF